MKFRVQIAILMAAAAAQAALADVRVQDVARLQGQRTNTLQGFGLVVGLNGTGDGGKYANTMRALMAMHTRYQQPVLDVNELKANSNVALVMVEATIPEFGAREGQAIDVVVSCIGPAKSLRGGQLLVTPLQEGTLQIPRVFALASGRVELPEKDSPTRGVIRKGATLEEDFFYNFIDQDVITLVLDDSQAGFPLAQMVARAVNHELANPASGGVTERDKSGELVVQRELAVAIGPKNVLVRIPNYELDQPTSFISRVLEAPLFAMPEQAARVVINRTTRNISFTGAVTISPTVLQIPGLGTVSVGNPAGGATPNVVALDTQKVGGVSFQELLDTLSSVKLSPDQMIEAVEHLHRTGTLHAQLTYVE